MFLEFSCMVKSMFLCFQANYNMYIFSFKLFTNQITTYRIRSTFCSRSKLTYSFIQIQKDHRIPRTLTFQMHPKSLITNKLFTYNPYSNYSLLQQSNIYLQKKSNNNKTLICWLLRNIRTRIWIPHFSPIKQTQ
jgi:hypothetical protein